MQDAAAWALGTLLTGPQTPEPLPIPGLVIVLTPGPLWDLVDGAVL